MDNVINQSTVINGEKSNVYIGKKFDGYVASGYSVFIGCSGTVQISMEEAKQFTLINCPNLIVENPYGNNVPVIRDGYAIGDYYFSANENPASKFGGHWEEISNGTFLMAAGAGGTADQTGGEATHTLTIEEMPSHSHELNDIGLDWSAGPRSNSAQITTASGRVITVNAVGGGQAHNNLPPYRTAHIFKRIKDPTTGNL